MSRFRRAALVILILLSFAPAAVRPVLARETVPQGIEGEVTLSGELSVPAITTVKKGAVLRIEPGSDILVSAGAGIVVNGRLVIRGTEDAPVVIASEGEEPWKGISFYQGSDGEVRHLTLRSARVGIAILAAKVSLEDTLVSGSEKGIHLVKEANASIARCTLEENRVGIAVEMKSLGSVTRCRIRGNEIGVGIGSGGLTDLLHNSFEGNQVGVRVVQRFPGKVKGNLFEGNTVGIRLEQNGPDTVVEKNRFTDNREAAVQALSYTSPTVLNNYMEGGKYGVLAHQYSSPRILNNRIEGMEEAIHLNKKSSSVVEGNVITRSKVGLFLDFSSYPRVRDNTFEGNDMHVKLGRFQSTHWEASAGSKRIVMQTAARLNSRNPRLAQAGEEFPESVDLTGNWWDERTRSEMAGGGDVNVATIYDGHDLPVVTYEGFGDEEYRLDRVIFLPVLPSPPETAGLSGWKGGRDELGR